MKAKQKQNVVYAIEQAILCAVMVGGFCAALKFFAVIMELAGV